MNGSRKGKALLLVDLQCDFMPGGALAVSGGDELIPIVNRLMEAFSLVIASQDMHPDDHVSFARTHGMQVGDVIVREGVRQMLWPVHCVAGTKGVSLARGIMRERIDKYIAKGEDPLVDGYSVFFDNRKRKRTELDRFLRRRSVRHLYVAGLAIDYCVLATVLDGLDLGYKVTVIADACRAVELHKGDGERALGRMQERGAYIATSDEIIGTRLAGYVNE